jgi:hypothetical protein
MRALKNSSQPRALQHPLTRLSAYGLYALWVVPRAPYF